MVENISEHNILFAIIIRAGFKKDGIEFFTPGEFSQQLGYINRPKGHTIEPHTHKMLNAAVVDTHEVLFIKSGIVKISVFNNEQKFIQECLLHSGDVILLAAGGHSIDFVEDAELIEVKPGPYNQNDKIPY